MHSSINKKPKHAKQKLIFSPAADTHYGRVVFPVGTYVSLIEKLLLKALVTYVACKDHFDVTAKWLNF